MYCMNSCIWCTSAVCVNTVTIDIYIMKVANNSSLVSDYHHYRLTLYVIIMLQACMTSPWFRCWYIPTLTSSAQCWRHPSVAMSYVMILHLFLSFYLSWMNSAASTACFPRWSSIVWLTLPMYLYVEGTWYHHLDLWSTTYKIDLPGNYQMHHVILMSGNGRNASLSCLSAPVYSVSIFGAGSVCHSQNGLLLSN